MGILRTLY